MATKKLIKKNTLVSWIFILPSIIVLGIFNLYSVIWAFFISFKNPSLGEIRKAGLIDIPGKFVMFENYKKVLTDDIFYKALNNMLYFAIVFIPLTLIFSLLLALFVNKKMKGVNFFRSIIFIPYIVSVISASIIFLALFDSQKGFVNYIISSFSMAGPSWFSNEYLAMPVIALMSSWRRVGYFMLLYLAGLQNIPKSIYESSSIDGANQFQTFKYITIPMLNKITVVIFILLLRDVLTVFQEVVVMTGGGPVNSTITVPFLIFENAFNYYEYGLAAAMSYILFAITVFIVIIQKKLTKKVEY